MRATLAFFVRRMEGRDSTSNEATLMVAISKARSKLIRGLDEMKDIFRWKISKRKEGYIRLSA